MASDLHGTIAPSSVGRAPFPLAVRLPTQAAPATIAAERLAPLVPEIRARLRLGPDLTDAMLMDSLLAIADRRTSADRWRTAFSSAIGRRLAARGTDLNTALNIIIDMVAAELG